MPVKTGIQGTDSVRHTVGTVSRLSGLDPGFHRDDESRLDSGFRRNDRIGSSKSNGARRAPFDLLVHNTLLPFATFVFFAAMIPETLRCGEMKKFHGITG
jgi:hypothetical protein